MSNSPSPVLKKLTPVLVVDRVEPCGRIVKPRHTTFYGSTEIYIREPGGFMVGFAEFTP